MGQWDRGEDGQIANGTDWKTLLVWSASGGQMQFLKAFSFLEGLVSGEDKRDSACYAARVGV